MKKFLETNRLHHLFGWTLLVLLLALLILEGWRYGVKPSEENNEELVENSLDKASDYFLEKQKNLLENTENLAATLQPALLQDHSHSSLSGILNQFPDFWGSALFQQDDPIVWRAFALQNIDNPQRNEQSESNIQLKRHNNVIYWECHVPFILQDSAGTVSYDLFTSYRVKQDNPLSIGDRTEFNLFDDEEFSSSYSLSFNIFSDPPTQFIESQQLSNLQGDSVGVVYATADQFEQAKAKWEQNTRFWRSAFALFCFIVFLFILFVAVDQLSRWTSLILQLLFIGAGWSIFAFTKMPSYWILTLSGLSSEEAVSTVESLSSTFTTALFILFAAITIYRKLKHYHHTFKADWYLSTIALSGVFGVVNALSTISFFNILFQATVASGVPLLDLRIFPATGTIFLYLVIGVAALAAGSILVAINQMLFRITKEHLKLTTSILSTTFFISLFVFQLFVSEQFIFNWMFYSSILAFGIILAISADLEIKGSWISSMSSLRKVVLGSLIIAITCISVIYQASLRHLDDHLQQTATNYAQKEDPSAEKLTRDLLIELESNFGDISKEDLQEKQSILQTQFTETIESTLSPEWNPYSLNLQLINTDGSLIADYATNLNSPNWVNVFNISTLEAVTEIEQITKSTIQPIVQLPELINQEDYQTFYRGWIPVFGTSVDTPIAWILCSVYQVRPQFNKPIRAVMASLTYDDWHSGHLMQRFQDGRLVNSIQQGFTGYFPKYRNLSQNMVQTVNEDSLIYMNEETAENSYRTLLWKESDEHIIKASTTLPDYRLILYSFFRLSFVLLLVGCLGILLWQLLVQKNLKLFERNKRFQDRILDSFLLATLLFLIFLIATSHFAIKQQNQDIVRQELVDKLERLSKSIETNPAINNQDWGSSFSLDTLTMPLDADASFYTGRKVTETTTPQIYQQHLLPVTIPYEIYHQLFREQQQDAYSTVQLAGQSLLIGYRSILNEEGEPIATISIPTFLESPKYNQQLLETTSYLILIYLMVFGLFILGSTFISRQLTRPLVYIQRGLNKISGGNLDTTIPVKSNDEIGSLAEAYNNMVFRLKKLQKELATAEREAAWKEMAQQVAHEIKNPLTPMKLNVQHLERQLKGNHQNPEELKKRVQKITENLIEQIQTLNNIASDFSKFSQPLDQEFTKVDMTSILSSVAELYEHDEKVDIHFQKNSSIYAKGIRDELKRVIINLVKNAYEAMPEGGKIELNLYQQQQSVFIEVEDSGEGIPEEARPNIFVPNFSTKSSGTGLGLAICKKIVEAHDGSISFASIEGEGTTFVVKLPQG